MNKQDKKTVWAQKISCADILFFMAKSCFADIRVNYDRFQRYPLAARLLRFLERAGLRTIFFPVEMTLHKVDEKGYALNYTVEKELSLCIDDFLMKRVPQESERFRNMLKSYMSAVLKDNLKNKAIFITMVASEINSKKEPAAKSDVIYLSGHPLNYLLRNFYRNRGFVIQWPFISINTIAFYLRPLCYLGFFLLSKLTGSKVNSSISDIKPAIWVEYYPGRWHTFWMDKIKHEGFDVVSYLDRSDTPITPKAISEIESHNSKWCDAHLWALIRMSRSGSSAFKDLFSGLFKPIFSKPAWLGIFRFEYTFFFHIYKSVFLRYKVKILIQHQECSWKQECQALAIERSGGIMVGYHWSAYPYYTMVTENFPQHVYFVWGRMMSELLRKKDNVRRYVLPSGICITSEGKDGVKEKTFAAGVDFVISVFDSSAAYNSFQSPASLAEFYLRIMNTVKNHSNFGCAIKSKGPLYQSILPLPSGEKILQEIEALRMQNRLKAFDFNEYPLTAAAHASLSVGYGINSACVVAAANGDHRAINWDCSGFKGHPFYKFPGQKVVFKTLDELEEAILSASRGDKTIGDHSRWKKYFNYFDDYSAVNRMVNFLESYMKVNASSGDPEYALNFTVQKYLSDNKVGKDFYQKEDLWGDE